MMHFITQNRVAASRILALGFLLAALLLLAASLLLAARPADASTTFTVTNTTDANNLCDADGCSLREAITAANNIPTLRWAGPDPLQHPPGRRAEHTAYLAAADRLRRQGFQRLGP